MRHKEGLLAHALQHQLPRGTADRLFCRLYEPYRSYITGATQRGVLPRLERDASTALKLEADGEGRGGTTATTKASTDRETEDREIHQPCGSCAFLAPLAAQRQAAQFLIYAQDPLSNQRCRISKSN